MTGVTLVSGPPSAAVTLTRGSTNPTTIVNAPAVTVALTRQVGDGPTGPAGQAGGEAFTHEQASAQAVWVINHNLGHYPTAVAVLSPGLQEMGAEVQHISTNQTQVRFASPQSGLARII